jgi:hypothetical protein
MDRSDHPTCHRHSERSPSDTGTCVPYLPAAQRGSSGCGAALATARPSAPADRAAQQLNLNFQTRCRVSGVCLDKLSRSILDLHILELETRQLHCMHALPGAGNRTARAPSTAGPSRLLSFLPNRNTRTSVGQLSSQAHQSIRNNQMLIRMMGNSEDQLARSFL